MIIFGTWRDGRTAHLYTITNGKGVAAVVSDLGAALVSLNVPDRGGKSVDVVLGYDTLAEYEANVPYLGTTIGRFANRIVGGRFTIEGPEYKLDLNNGPNHLHGGIDGFNKRLWNARQTAQNSISFSLFSPHMDQGYPGNLVVSVTYTVTDDNALCIAYCGMSDKTTPLNLTNHSYFNLAGQDSNSVLSHYLRIDADSIAPVDGNSSVTGEITEVTGTPFDFRSGKQIGADISAAHDQLGYTSGFDHHYFLRHSGGSAAEAYCEQSGISMAVFTDMPGVQLYTANFLQEGLMLKGGRKANRYRAFCLETQHAPDAMNKPQFGDDALLYPGTCMCSATRYVFSTGQPSWVK